LVNNYIANCSKNLCNHSIFHATASKYSASNIVLTSLCR